MSKTVTIKQNGDVEVVINDSAIQINASIETIPLELRQDLLFAANKLVGLGANRLHCEEGENGTFTHRVYSDKVEAFNGFTDPVFDLCITNFDVLQEASYAYHRQQYDAIPEVIEEKAAEEVRIATGNSYIFKSGQ